MLASRLGMSRRLLLSPISALVHSSPLPILNFPFRTVPALPPPISLVQELTEDGLLSFQTVFLECCHTRSPLLWSIAVHVLQQETEEPRHRTNGSGSWKYELSGPLYKKCLYKVFRLPGILFNPLFSWAPFSLTCQFKHHRFLKEPFELSSCPHHFSLSLYPDFFIIFYN